MSKRVVIPGEFLSFEEEYLGGINTFTDKNGNVFSECVGTPVFDADSHTVDVKAFHPLAKLSVSSIVIARVKAVKDKVVVVEILFVEAGEERQVLAPSGAFIRVANVSQDYVKSLHDEFKIGDLVRAKVCEVTPFGIQLRTNEAGLGVLKSYCSRCRFPLRLFGSVLKCLNCGATEKRKISKEYYLK